MSLGKVPWIRWSCVWCEPSAQVSMATLRAAATKTLCPARCLEGWRVNRVDVGPTDPAKRNPSTVPSPRKRNRNGEKTHPNGDATRVQREYWVPRTSIHTHLLHPITAVVQANSRLQAACRGAGTAWPMNRRWILHGQAAMARQTDSVKHWLHWPAKYAPQSCRHPQDLKVWKPSIWACEIS